MKKLLCTILVSLCSLTLMLMLQDCQKMPINGNLDGQWQIMEIEVNGEVVENPWNRYICIQLHTVQITQGYIYASGNMTYDYPKVGFDFPNAIGADTRERLKEWGIYQNPVVFDIETLTSKKLVMSAAGVRVSCRKF